MPFSDHKSYSAHIAPWKTIPTECHMLPRSILPIVLMCLPILEQLSLVPSPRKDYATKWYCPLLAAAGKTSNVSLTVLAI